MKSRQTTLKEFTPSHFKEHDFSGCYIEYVVYDGGEMQIDHSYCAKCLEREDDCHQFNLKCEKQK